MAPKSKDTMMDSLPRWLPSLPQLAEVDGAGCDASWAVDNVQVHTR